MLPCMVCGEVTQPAAAAAHRCNPPAAAPELPPAHDTGVALPNIRRQQERESTFLPINDDRRLNQPSSYPGGGMFFVPVSCRDEQQFMDTSSADNQHRGSLKRRNQQPPRRTWAEVEPPARHPGTITFQLPISHRSWTPEHDQAGTPKASHPRRRRQREDQPALSQREKTVLDTPLTTEELMAARGEEPCTYCQQPVTPRSRQHHRDVSCRRAQAIREKTFVVSRGANTIALRAHPLREGEQCGECGQTATCWTLNHHRTRLCALTEAAREKTRLGHLCDPRQKEDSEVSTLSLQMWCPAGYRNAAELEALRNLTKPAASSSLPGRSRPCGICGRPFGSKSLPIHLPQCRRKAQLAATHSRSPPN